MTEYKVAFEKGAQRALQKMDRRQANFIMAWIKKNLVGTENHRGKWRYRVGDYRLNVNISDETATILILGIGHRREVYD
jgi:mRNA interferase RelE/StbE